MGRERVILGGVGAVGLMLVGGAIGHVISPPTWAGEHVITAAAVPDEETDAPVARMPDINGLELPTARRVLSEYGVEAKVTTRERPAAGPVGLVVEQQPAAGDDVGDSVTLTTSTAADMPDLAGSREAVARSTLEGLGAFVRIEPVVDPRNAGEVLTTVPAAGQPLGLVATLRVAIDGVGLDLSQLDLAGYSECDVSSDSTTTLGGKEVADTLACFPDDAPAFVAYAVRKRADVFEATLGIDDQHDAGSANVRVLADGKLVGSWDVGANTATPIRVVLRGATRLRLEVIARAGAPRVVFGSARLVGQQAQLDELVGFS